MIVCIKYVIGYLKSIIGCRNVWKIVWSVKRVFLEFGGIWIEGFVVGEGVVGWLWLDVVKSEELCW